MVINQVNFRKFSIEAKPIIDSLPAYQPNSWPEDWEIAVVPMGDQRAIIDWSADQVVGSIGLLTAHNGDVLVAFENPTDAILFKISYPIGV